MTASVDFKEIQGIVRFGYRDLTDALFLLLKIKDAAAARAWLAGAPVTSAETRETAPPTALQVALTAAGLQALGVPPEVVSGFAPEFVSGMAGEESRSRRLGDVAASSPESWRWGWRERVPHLLVLLYARPGQLQPWSERVRTALWDDAFEVLETLGTSNLDGTEPFGFVDGISQPSLDWERRRTPEEDQLDYGNLVSLGEFLLGYPNEYGKYTDRPLLDAAAPGAAQLPPAEDVPDSRDLGRNGSYLVFRHLQQDVRGFWSFCDARAASNDKARQALAESMVGRRMNGDPLLPLAQEPIPGVEPRSAAQNGFTYDSDPRGIRCPFGAHIRRSNPRNPDLPGKPATPFAKLFRALGFGAKSYREDAQASARFHRLLRRGREFGPPLSVEQALGNAPDSGEHGIHFICLAANISRQFEFVQNAWIMNTKFNAMTGESDPLLGNRQKVEGSPRSDTFRLSRESGLPDRITEVPQFITVRGGAYFFLPSIAALRYFGRTS
jgi:Dyp-type peroxidase family